MPIKCTFATQPECSPFPDNIKLIRTNSDWFYYVGSKMHKVPAGWWFDGASIPRVLWPIIGSHYEPRFWAPALAHDFGYTVHWEARATYDEMFRQFLIANKVSTALARTMWLSVRAAGGGSHWKNNPADIEEMNKFGLIPGIF